MSKKSEHPKDKPLTNPDQHEGEQNPSPNKVHVHGDIKVGRSPSLTDEHNTERSEDKAHQRKKYLVERLTLILVGLGFGISAWQGFLTRTAITDARQSFAKDQRPYVWIANPLNGRANVGYDPSPTNAMAVTVHYTNFGKSPAVGLQWASEFHVGDFVSRAPMSTKKTILPTTKDDFLIFLSPPLTPEQIINFKSTQHAIVVKIWWKYSDTSGNRYETDTCNWNITPFAWGPCETGNAIRDCQEEACQQ